MIVPIAKWAARYKRTSNNLIIVLVLGMVGKVRRAVTHASGFKG